jgi:4-amino-4-deoxy-L-arabinose transferase-like glycosyltransferase
MIARNFYEREANIMYPEIDYAGSNSGIIGSEFPLFNYLIYIISLLFGYDHWYGRLINLIVSSIGIYYFYRLIKSFSNATIAFNASIILLSSIWFAFSRKIMPDTFSISLVIIGLYFSFKYLKFNSVMNLILFFLFATLGILSKLSALYLIFILLILIFIKNVSVGRKITVWIITWLAILISSLWYFVWVPTLIARYHNKLYFPRGIIEGLKEILPLANEFFKNFYFNAFHSYIAFSCCIIGVYLILSGYNRYFKFGLIILSFSFFGFILKTGYVFPTHNYYIIPFVPVMAFCAGLALNRIQLKYQYIILGLIIIEGVINQQHDFFIRKEQVYKMDIETIASTFTMPSDLIVINGGPSPQEIYLANRKGWSVTNDKINLLALESYAKAGATYLIINHKTYIDSIDYLPQIGQMNHFKIYSLRK